MLLDIEAIKNKKMKSILSPAYKFAVFLNHFIGAPQVQMDEAY